MWTSGRLGADVLSDLETYKIPAMRQAKVCFAKDGPQIVLISKSGFKAGLVSLALQRDDLQLIDAGAVADDLAQLGRAR
jgi:hypothetical protein